MSPDTLQSSLGFSPVLGFINIPKKIAEAHHESRLTMTVPSLHQSLSVKRCSIQFARFGLSQFMVIVDVKAREPLDAHMVVLVALSLTDWKHACKQNSALMFVLCFLDQCFRNSHGGPQGSHHASIAVQTKRY
jgi:hypothetical protein